MTLLRSPNDPNNFRRFVLNVEWMKRTEKGENREGDRTRRGGLRERHREEHKPKGKVTKSNQTFHSNKLSSPSYNFPFIVVEGERSGRDNASRCFARAWTVTPVFVKFDESVRAVRCIVEWLTR